VEGGTGRNDKGDTSKAAIINWDATILSQGFDKGSRNTYYIANLAFTMLSFRVKPPLYGMDRVLSYIVSSTSTEDGNKICPLSPVNKRTKPMW
jgi:hypothetical protein